MKRRIHKKTAEFPPLSKRTWLQTDTFYLRVASPMKLSKHQEELCALLLLNNVEPGCVSYQLETKILEVFTLW